MKVILKRRDDGKLYCQVYREIKDQEKQDRLERSLGKFFFPGCFLMLMEISVLSSFQAASPASSADTGSSSSKTACVPSQVRQTKSE